MDQWRPGDLVGAYDTDTGQVRFEQAEYVNLPAHEPFHVFDNGSLYMELSPEHKVLYEDYRGRMQTCTAAHMARKPSVRRIPTTFSLDKPDAPVSDEGIRWRVAFSADGNIPAAGQQVKVVVRKERKKERLRWLLDACGFEWKETVYENRPTETQFHVYWDNPSKSLDFVWLLSTRQLEVVMDEVDHWDGLHDHAEKRYTTTVKEHAEAMQYAAHATGRRATIRVYSDPRSEAWAPVYTVAIFKKDGRKNTSLVRDTTRQGIRYAPDGRKYCFTTSTGFFVARCNETVFVTGNSAKTTGLFFKLVYMAKKQAKAKDGKRYSRAVVVRNTAPQLNDTTIASWSYWFRDGQAGKWRATDKKFTLMFDDVECEVLFRPLDTPDDVARVLSLEVTFAIIDEFVQVPREIIEALSGRCGRYPSGQRGTATNWGMWGASNPDTEDNWWYDYLHTNPEVQRVTYDKLQTLKDDDRPIARYFVQPSGFSPHAENIENLPGHEKYYENQARGKSEAYIKQFIEAEWGFSIAGRPVVPTFKPSLHLTKDKLYDPRLELVVGFDPGVRGLAAIFGQEDLHGRLRVLGELTASGYGAERFIKELMRPYIREHFPECRITVAPDPQAAARTPTDEKTVVDAIRRYYPVQIESNNRLSLRLEAIEHYTTRLTSVGPALLIDEEMCPTLVRALRGGWRYTLDPKKGTLKSPEPEKNAYSHPGDAFGYLCRYLHRGTERSSRYNTLKTAIRRTPQGTYHMR